MRAALLTILLLVFGLPAMAAEWRSTSDSEFTFEVSFEGEPLPGSFRTFDVEIDFDPNAPETASLRVTVDLTAADMGDPDMNAVLFDPAWFDTEQFAEAVFSSDRIVAVDDGFAASGALDLKGSQGSVVVRFAWVQSMDSATMQGAFVIRRTDFDVGEGEWANGDSIGLDVTLEFDVRLEPKD